MKLNRLLASAVAVSAIMSSGVMAADGTITFTGSVTASACTTITGVSAGGASALNQTINLPAVTATALNKATGTFAGNTAFKISLAGCAATGALSNVRALFDTPFAPPADPYVIGNTATNGASNVAIAILTPAGAQIDLNGGAAVDPGKVLPTTSGNVVMDFVAAYKSLSTGVTSGAVAGTANYTISYF